MLAGASCAGNRCRSSSSSERGELRALACALEATAAAAPPPRDRSSDYALTLFLADVPPRPSEQVRAIECRQSAAAVYLPFVRLTRTTSNCGVS